MMGKSRPHDVACGGCTGFTGDGFDRSLHRFAVEKQRWASSADNEEPTTAAKARMKHTFTAAACPGPCAKESRNLGWHHPRFMFHRVKLSTVAKLTHNA